MMRRVVLGYVSFLATCLVTTRPIRRVAGWWSGYAFSKPFDANERLRSKLWDALKGRDLSIKWYDGLRLELQVGNDISRLIFVGGEIDPNEFAFIDEFLQPGMCALDVGANEGLYTLFFRKRIGASGHVIAIEPSTRELERLKRNLRCNSFADVELHSVAVGDHIGFATLHVAEPEHAGHNALGPFAAHWVQTSSQSDVPLTTLDAMATTAHWPRIDLIKLDIEGMEFAALCGADALVRRHRPVILFEAEPESLALRGATLPAALSWLRERGYEILEFSPTDGSPRPIAIDCEPTSVNLVAVPR
jgi:FkbM family methyltransferase